jgi:hypothetical protein
MFRSLYYVYCLCVCAVLLPPDVNPVAVKYIYIKYINYNILYPETEFYVFTAHRWFSTHFFTGLKRQCVISISSIGSASLPKFPPKHLVF